MIYYTGDLHFGHQNVIKFDNRPFEDLDEMERVLINNWNARVQPGDTVYILGDFCYRNDKAAKWYLQQLKGHKVLIIGNSQYPLHKKVINKLTPLGEWAYNKKWIFVI